MRDTTKVVLLRHEHSANTLSKSRLRQAQDFRRQVEERKSELERLERKLFATSIQIINNNINSSIIKNSKFINRPNIYTSRQC